MPTSPKGVSPLGESVSPLEDYVLGLSPSTVTPTPTPSNPRRCGGAQLHAASSSAKLPEEDVAGGLHQPPAGVDAVSSVLVDVLREVSLQH